MPSIETAAPGDLVLPPRQAMFVPQKARAIRRVRWLTAAAAVLIAPLTAVFRSWRS
jgi:hypothetical protein